MLACRNSWTSAVTETPEIRLQGPEAARRRRNRWRRRHCQRDPATLHPTPYTLHLAPHAFHPRTLYPTPYALHPTPCPALPKSHTLKSRPPTMHPILSNLHPATGAAALLLIQKRGKSPQTDVKVQTDKKIWFSAGKSEQGRCL